MARSPSLPLGGYDDMSSPDPLASPKEHEEYRFATRSPSPSKSQKSKTYMNATPPRTSQSRWINAASPSKTVTEQRLSPWKIRVTVETEPDDTSAGSAVPASRTIMVPLRDTSSPAEDKAHSSRGRSSQPGITKSRRNATPVRKSVGPKTRRQSVTDLDITVLGDDGDSNDWTKRKSPKKRKPTPSRPKKPQIEQQDNNTNNSHDSSTKGLRRKSTRLVRNVAIREDTDASDDAGLDAAVESDSPELRSIDLNRVSVRSRSVSSKQPQQPPSTLIATNQDGVLPEDSQTKSKPSAEKQPIQIPATYYPTPDPSVQDDLEVDEPASQQARESEGFDTILESEGFTMIDLDSLPSARQFHSSPPMIPGANKTVERMESSKRSDPELLDQSPLQEGSDVKHSSKPNAIPAYLALQEGESDISSNVPSSPITLSQPELLAVVKRPSTECPIRKVTPLQYSSPKLPSPPKAGRPLGVLDAGPVHKSTPTLAKVVKAGIALQGVLSPRSPKVPQRSPRETPRERLDSLFEGFDSGTRRELRAGLRLGEELAKRQRSGPNEELRRTCETGERLDDAKLNHVEVSTKQHLPVTQVWRGETIVQHSPVHTALNEVKQGDSVQKTLGAPKNRADRSQPAQKSPLCNETRFSDSTPDICTRSQFVRDSQKQREAQWQREREAVSSEIENASSSQVIIIDSDEEHQSKNGDDVPVVEDFPDGQDETDIWCEEAASCDQRSSARAARTFPATKNVSTHKAEVQGQQDSPQETLQKPRRSVIPSAWRHGKDAMDESSYLTSADMTGLFYHEPKSKIKFGAAEIDRQRRQFSSGSFDIDRMIGSPQKPQFTDSQDPTQDGESFESIMSDAEQLQSELSAGHGSFEANSNISEELSPRVTIENSLIDEGDVGEEEESASISTEEDTSLAFAPQPIKIPVNFNDSTLSNIASHLARSSTSTEPEPARPNTPRSALKGGRQSFGLADADLPAVRKVGFSTHEIRVSPEGEEEERSMQSISLSLESVGTSCSEEEQPLPPCDAKIDLPNQKSGVFGWVWGNTGKEDKTSPRQTDENSCEDEGWQQTRTSIAQRPRKARSNAASNQPPSYLLPPSYPSDPTRNVKIPLSTSGNFTNTHFRTLHIIYAKSLRPRFHGPKVDEVRPNLSKLFDTAFEADESRCGLGVFEWKVDEAALRVLERFMREVEWGHPDPRSVQWGWTESDICEKLFRLIVGEEVRKEEKAARESLEAI